MEYDKRSNQRFGPAQREVISFIHSNDYDFALPTLADEQWDCVLNSDLEREKLEFFGDSVLNEAVSTLLVQTWPNGTPQFYTMTRSALTSNRTFSHLMSKANLYSLDGHINYKIAADAFESILGLYHRAYGRQAFEDWFNTMFPPIVRVAGKAASQHCSGSRKYKGIGKNQVLLDYRAVKSELPAFVPLETMNMGLPDSSKGSMSESSHSEEHMDLETDSDEDVEPKLNDEDSRKAIYHTISRSPFIRKASMLFEPGAPVLDTPCRPSMMYTPGRWNNPIVIEDTPMRPPTAALSRSSLQFSAGMPVTPIPTRGKTAYTPGRAENPIILF